MLDKHYRLKFEFTFQNLMSKVLQKTSGQMKTLMDLVVANVIVSSKKNCLLVRKQPIYDYA